jgi:hypothetical protein
MLLQDHLKTNGIYVGLFLIRQSLSGGVRLLGTLPSHVEGVKEAMVQGTRLVDSKRLQKKVK